MLWTWAISALSRLGSFCTCLTAEFSHAQEILASQNAHLRIFRHQEIIMVQLWQLNSIYEPLTFRCSLNVKDNVLLV